MSFRYIDEAIRQIDSPGNDESDPYVPRFDQQSYSPSEICEELDISNPTLQNYANKAGIQTPGVGKRNFLYSAADRETIFRYVTEKVSDKKIREAARQHLAKIEVNRKTQNK